MRKKKADEFADNELSEQEVVNAARGAFTFLAACVAGEVADATVNDRVWAARSLLEHASRVPRLLNQLGGAVDALTGEDLELIGGVLE